MTLEQMRWLIDYAVVNILGRISWKMANERKLVLFHVFTFVRESFVDDTYSLIYSGFAFWHCCYMFQLQIHTFSTNSHGLSVARQF